MARQDTFYFYDLETSHISPREGRIMQFAGQRTDMNLKSVGEPHNFLIKLSEEVLPDPYAVLVTGITPQQTRADGITEQAFLDIFEAEIAIPGTIFSGFNSVRFDDEFIRYLLYRNFYDPYEWHYKDGRSRFELLDVIRMTRALRPEGIKWPVDTDGKATNRLQLLTGINNLDHQNAHDALSDVQATIALAQLILSKQPKLFTFLLDMRHKAKVAELVNAYEPFVYTSGKYPGEFEKTTIAVKLADHPRRQGALVYDLRHDPTDLADLSPQELMEAWRRRFDEPGLHLPVKTLQYNRCPAVAPLGVLDPASQKRLQLSPKVAQANLEKLKAQKDLVDRLLKAVGLMDEQQSLKFANLPSPIDAQLYDGFFGDSDRRLCIELHQQTPAKLMDMQAKFQDKRLKQLLPLYKARNFANQLSEAEVAAWERFRRDYLLSGGEDSRLANYFKRLEEIKERPKLSNQDKYIVEELQLYGESLIPAGE